MTSEERAEKIRDRHAKMMCDEGRANLVAAIAAAIDAAVAEERKLYNAAWDECKQSRAVLPNAGNIASAFLWDFPNQTFTHDSIRRMRNDRHAHDAARRAAGLEVER